jgi:hypothetical protein
MVLFPRIGPRGCWYASPRFFVVPMEYAEDLASAIEAAARGEQESEPDWYVNSMNNTRGGHKMAYPIKSAAKTRPRVVLAA